MAALRPALPPGRRHGHRPRQQTRAAGMLILPVDCRIITGERSEYFDKDAAMLTQYIQAAIAKAKYEVLEDDDTFVGTIPGFRGVWSNASTLEACREELLEVLEDWIVVHLRLGHDLPKIRGIPAFPRKFKDAG